MEYGGKYYVVHNIGSEKSNNPIQNEGTTNLTGTIVDKRQRLLPLPRDGVHSCSFLSKDNSYPFLLFWGS